MQDKFIRTEMLLGEEAMKKLASARVAVFGLGGVGGFIAEALARCGIGALDLIDNDRFTESNLNRQLFATSKTLGMYKADAAAERIKDINADIDVKIHKTFFTAETANMFDFGAFDYVADAIDTVSGKIELVLMANAAKTPIISSMGTGNKLDPTAFEVTDIYKTSVCPLARVMRRELKSRGVKSLKVVYSKEPALTPLDLKCEKQEISENAPKRQTPGSVSFVPSVAGLIIAGEIIKDIIGR